MGAARESEGFLREEGWVMGSGLRGLEYLEI